MMRATEDGWTAPLSSPAFFGDAATMLGQSSIGSGGAQSIALWSGALIGGVILGAVALFALRRRLLGGAAGSTEALTLHDLRDLHARGVMTDEEYEAARAAMLGLPAPDEMRAAEGFDLTGEPLPPVDPAKRGGAGDP